MKGKKERKASFHCFEQVIIISYWTEEQVIIETGAGDCIHDLLVLKQW